MSNDTSARSTQAKRRKGKKSDGNTKPIASSQTRTPPQEAAGEKPCNPFRLLDGVDEQGSVRKPAVTEWRSGRAGPMPVAAGKCVDAPKAHGTVKGASSPTSAVDTVSVHISVFQNQHRVVDEAFVNFKPLRRVDVDQKISTSIVSRLVKAGVGNPTLLLITCRIPSTPHPKLVVLQPSDTLRKYLPGSRPPQSIHVDVFKVEASDRNKSTLDKFADVTFAFLKKVSEMCGLPVWAVKRHLEANFDQSFQSHSLLQHQCEDHDQWATWNTGLIDSSGSPLFVFFFRNDRTRNKPWSLKGGNTPVYTETQVRQWLKIKPTVRLPTSALSVKCLQHCDSTTDAASDIDSFHTPCKVESCSSTASGSPKSVDGGASMGESVPSVLFEDMSQDSSPRHSDVHSMSADDKSDVHSEGSCRSTVDVMEHRSTVDEIEHRSAVDVIEHRSAVDVIEHRSAVNVMEHRSAVDVMEHRSAVDVMEHQDSYRPTSGVMEHDICCSASIMSDESDQSSCGSHNLHDMAGSQESSSEPQTMSMADKDEDSKAQVNVLCEASLRKLLKATEAVGHVTSLHDCLGTWQEAATLLQNLYFLRQTCGLLQLPALCSQGPARRSIELVDEGDVLQWMPQDLLAGA